MFKNIYYKKKVLITGHTGFKGTWLTLWLLKLGAKVVGVSKDIPTNPSMYEELNLHKKIKNYTNDIRDIESIKKIIFDESPDFLFHLAAQAIVSTSYTQPTETISTNVVGTMNILESLRSYKKKMALILITSDKCYDNVEWVWGYKESDPMGGKDIYSGSKGAAELIIKSYYNSFFGNNHSVKLSIGRAGNVIGGGDWAKDRIIVDCMVSWSKNDFVKIRSPKATRPWQHVLEPLSGYLALGENIYNNNNLDGEAFNFGPKAEQNRSVLELLIDLRKYWNDDNGEYYKIIDEIPFHEAGLLKLNCDKALFHLKWESNLFYEETISFVGKWYFNFYRKKEDMFQFSMTQIDFYEKLAKKRNKSWTT